MKRALLVDDNDAYRKMLRQMLSALGYDVVEARNGVEALKLEHHLPCDVILTDLVMPEKDGLETIRALRRKDPWLPIVAMSGGSPISGPDRLKMAQVIGANSTLTKPFTADELESVIPSVRGMD